jgi:prepilin-type N-terminal cleavage/methylation domain-containing protein
MKKRILNNSGFTLLELSVSIGIFLIFCLGIYSTLSMVFKIVYQSRLKILETAVLSEQLEIARNLAYDNVGLVNGIPSGSLLRSQVISRNGISFLVTTTVRNIDDSFDGVLGGTPKDTSPADYKQVEVSGICLGCGQKEPVILSTIISPKNLEGASKNGALFIHVFDSNGIGVAGANVKVTNTAQTPNIIIEEVTDNDGNLAIIDAPTGTLSYHINVSKSGYNSDYTVTSSAQNPNPLKPPANVVSQAITEISFSIDYLSSLSIRSVDQNCNLVSGPSVSLYGDKTIGANPNVYKTNQSFSLSSGSYNLNSLEWDNYHMSLSGGSYDLAGSVPMLPIKMTPGLSQDLYLVMRPHTTNSILVKVKDAGTGLPLSDATVRLYNSSSFDDAIQTDLGYIRQTDWSSGSSQLNFNNEAQYYSDSGSIDSSSQAGDLKLKKTGGFYSAGGTLESSTFDLGGSVTLRNLIFEPISQPAQTGSSPIKFQLAATNTAIAEGWNFIGPDGTENSFFTSTSTVINSVLNNNRYMRYKVFLSTENNTYTPTLSEVNITYSNSCVPPGQAFFRSLSSGNYSVEVTRSGYGTVTVPVSISGNSEVEVNLSSN